MSKTNLREISLTFHLLDVTTLNRKFLASSILIPPFLPFFYLSVYEKTTDVIFSVKLGSYKFVMASTSEAVNEMLVKKSSNYAGRPQTYVFITQSLGKLMVT